MLTFGFKYELTVNGKTSVEPQCFTKYFCCKWARRGSRFEKMLEQHCESNRSAEIP